MPVGGVDPAGQRPQKVNTTGTLIDALLDAAVSEVIAEEPTGLVLEGTAAEAVAIHAGVPLTESTPPVPVICDLYTVPSTQNDTPRTVMTFELWFNTWSALANPWERRSPASNRCFMSASLPRISIFQVGDGALSVRRTLTYVCYRALTSL